MYATDFTYAGESLSSKGLVIICFDTDGGLETVSIGSDLTINTVRPVGSNRWVSYGSEYSEPISKTFQVGKIKCGGDLEELSVDEQGKIMAWLNKKEFNILKFNQTGFENLFFNATFNVQKVELGGRCVGFELTFQTDSPYAYVVQSAKNFTVTSVNGTVSLVDPSDEIGYVYPVMTVTTSTAGNLTIKNSAGLYTTSVTGCKAGEKITFDGMNQIIKTSSSTPIADRFNYRFPRIVNKGTGGTNVFTFSLPCTVTISYNPIKKVSI